MKKLPFWCQKVLPLAYDGALSYYEAISKVVAKLNELIGWSNGVDATVSAAGEAANEAEDKAIEALNAAERAEGKATEAKATANEAKSIAQGIAGDIPTKTSELTNDSGFITEADIPTKTSDLTNDSGFVNATQAANAAPVQSVNGQTGDVVVSGGGAVDSVNGQTGDVVLNIPTKTSDLTNDSGFVTDADIPTKTSELTNDSNFITREQVLTWPAVSDDMTTLQVMAFAQNRPSAALSWNKYGNCTYTPTQSATASWVFQLNSKQSSSSIYVYFTATNTVDGSMYSCDASGVWHKLVQTPTVAHVNGSAVNVSTGTATTIQTITLSPGVYAIQFIATFASNATGYRYIRLATTSGGGAMDRYSAVSAQAANGETTRITFTTFFSLSSSTTYYLVAMHNSGSTLSVTPGYRYMKLA